MADAAIRMCLRINTKQIHLKHTNWEINKKSEGQINNFFSHLFSLFWFKCSRKNEREREEECTI